MIMSKTGLHLVRAMVVLARLPEGEYARTSEIAEDINAPKNYLSKLLQLLAKQGLLISQKGLGGGFRLSRDPNEISLFDVVDPTEKLKTRPECFLGHTHCDEFQNCCANSRYRIVVDAYIQFLKDTVLADLVESKNLDETLAGPEQEIDNVNEENETENPDSTKGKFQQRS